MRPPHRGGHIHAIGRNPSRQHREPVEGCAWTAESGAAARAPGERTRHCGKFTVTAQVRALKGMWKGNVAAVPSELTARATPGRGGNCLRRFRRCTSQWYTPISSGTHGLLGRSSHPVHCLVTELVRPVRESLTGTGVRTPALSAPLALLPAARSLPGTMCGRCPPSEAPQPLRWAPGPLEVAAQDCSRDRVGRVLQRIH